MWKRSAHALREFVGIALDIVYPPHCAGCGVPTESVAVPCCHECWEALPRIRPPFCSMCGRPFEGGEGTFRCANCEGRRFAFEYAVCGCRAEGVVRDWVHRFKYGSETHLVRVLGDILAKTLADERLAGVDAIVPVPLHPGKERQRGFNQAQWLAERAAKHHGLPVLRALRRVKPTQTQTALRRSERMRNLRGAFALRKNTSVLEQKLLLVDDVLTTGSTLNECARVLKAAGARSVVAAAVARG